MNEVVVSGVEQSDGGCDGGDVVLRPRIWVPYPIAKRTKFALKKLGLEY